MKLPKKIVTLMFQHAHQHNILGKFIFQYLLEASSLLPRKHRFAWQTQLEASYPWNTIVLFLSR